VSSSSLWSTPYVPRFGIDIFETHTALGEGFKVKQAYLGSKVHEAKDPSKHLASMFHEVAGAMFSCTELYENAWCKVRGSETVEAVEGEVHMVAPEEIKVDLNKLLQEYKNGFPMFRRTYEKVLDPELLRNIERLYGEKEGHLKFPAEYWAKCVYSFAAAFKKGTNLREGDNLLEALRILWMSKVASFIIETIELDSKEAEEQILKEADVFEEFKYYLLDIY